MSIMSNLIVALSKKLIICEKQSRRGVTNFIAFERLDLKHSESDTRLYGQTLKKSYNVVAK
jgi:hypothetical protein